MKKLLLLTLTFGFLGISNIARADQQEDAAFWANPQYSCSLRGQISGASIGIVLGGEVISGPGVITCRNSRGVVRRMPITLKLIGGGAAFDFTIIKSIKVFSNGISTVNGPEDLVRSYAIGASAGATLGRAGVDFDAAAKVSSQGGLSFELGFQGRDVIGLGAHLNAMAFSIEPR
jgi:hypothetical protein